MASPLLGDAKGPIDGLSDFYGPRPPHRRTMGKSARTIAMATLKGFASDLHVLAMRHAKCNLCGQPWPCTTCKPQLQANGKGSHLVNPGPVPDPDFLMPGGGP